MATRKVIHGKPKCQVAGCENKATKRNRRSKLRYCNKHASMRHTYVFKKNSVPFTYDKIIGVSA